MPKVSVIIPTYQHGEHVLGAIQSVFAQTEGDYELIVVNDGSPDNTSELLRPLAKSGRIRYFEQQNAGQASARNLGLRKASGKFVGFLDDDDSWPPDKLAWQIKELEDNPNAVVAYGYAEILHGDTRGRHPAAAGPSGCILSAFAQGGFIRSPGQAVIRRDALNKIGGFDVSLWGVDDWDLWLRLAEVGEFIYRDKPALVYLEHENNASLKFCKMFKNGKKVRDKHFLSGKNKHLYGPCDEFLRSFVTFDGFRVVNILLGQGRRMEALRGMALLLIISRGRFGYRGQLKDWVKRAGGAVLRRLTFTNFQSCK